MKPLPELLERINRLNVRVYGLTSGKVIIGEVSQLNEDTVELNYASTVSSFGDNIQFAPAAQGENVSSPAIVYLNHIEFESEATLRLKKYYMDYLSISKISAYTKEDIGGPMNNHQPLDPKGYWQKIAGRLSP